MCPWSRAKTKCLCAHSMSQYPHASKRSLFASLGDYEPEHEADGYDPHEQTRIMRRARVDPDDDNYATFVDAIQRNLDGHNAYAKMIRRPMQPEDETPIENAAAFLNDLFAQRAAFIRDRVLYLAAHPMVVCARNARLHLMNLVCTILDYMYRKYAFSAFERMKEPTPMSSISDVIELDEVISEGPIAFSSDPRYDSSAPFYSIEARMVNHFAFLCGLQFVEPELIFHGPRQLSGEQHVVAQMCEIDDPVWHKTMAFTPHSPELRTVADFIRCDRGNLGIGFVFPYGPADPAQNSCGTFIQTRYFTLVREHHQMIVNILKTFVFQMERCRAVAGVVSDSLSAGAFHLAPTIAEYATFVPPPFDHRMYPELKQFIDGLYVY